MRFFSLFLLFLLFAGLSPVLSTGQQITAPLAEPQLESSGEKAADSVPAQELFGIKGPIEIPDHSTTLLMGIAALLAVLLLVLLIVLWRKRAGKQRAIQAHEQALQRLAQAELLIDNRDVDAFVTLIDQTLRRYIEQRFAISARRQTTHEFITGLTQGDLAVPELLANNSENLQTWLEHCDLVKFARGTLNRETMEAMLANLRSFIQSTLPEAGK